MQPVTDDSAKTVDVTFPTPLVGSGILGLVTAGMYDDPQAIYREYIQNAADALATAGERARGMVDIRIDVSGARAVIRDNGPGLSRDTVFQALVPIANSEKRRGADRGFRGIGRLSGLAFAESVAFRTRACDDEPVSCVTWDGRKLHSLQGVSETERAIQECVTIETLPGPDYPNHFFEVELRGIGRHAASRILNRENVRAYIGEVCPVPLHPEFPFMREISNLFVSDKVPLTLDVFVNGETDPITRRYGRNIRFSEGREANFTELEPIHIPTAEGEDAAAVGWIAHSDYLGAIPKAPGIRGIRALIGNIQIGNERTFDALFPEERFNRWCVGEIHILDPRIVPNGKRDYFELGPHVRNLENHLKSVFRGIAARCRRASIKRNRERKIRSALNRVDEIQNLAAAGYLFLEDAEALIEQAINGVGVAQSDAIAEPAEADSEMPNESKLTAPPSHAQHDLLPHSGIPKLEMDAYRRVFRAMAERSRSPRAEIEAIMGDLERRYVQGTPKPSRFSGGIKKGG